MARFILLSLAVVLGYCILQSSGVGLRGFPSSASSSAAASGCDTRTRLAKLNCSCALGNQQQHCLSGTNSFCIDGKCSCRGSSYPDCATGFFCRERFRVTSSIRMTTTNCAGTLPTIAGTVVNYGTGPGSQATRFITYENAARTVTCTPTPAIGATSKLAYSAVQINATTTELFVKGSGTAPTAVPGGEIIQWTCVDGCNLVQTVAVAHTITAATSCT